MHKSASTSDLPLLIDVVFLTLNAKLVCSYFSLFHSYMVSGYISSHSGTDYPTSGKYSVLLIQNYYFIII